MNKKSVPGIVKIGIYVAGIGSLFALAVMLIIAFRKTISVHGLDSYWTFWFVESNWISFMVFCGVLITVLLISSGFRFYNSYKERKEIRVLQKKYNQKKT